VQRFPDSYFTVVIETQTTQTETTMRLHAEIFFCQTARIARTQILPSGDKWVIRSLSGQILASGHGDTGRDELLALAEANHLVLS